MLVKSIIQLQLTNLALKLGLVNFNFFLKGDLSNKLVTTSNYGKKRIISNHKEIIEKERGYISFNSCNYYLKWYMSNVRVYH